MINQFKQLLLITLGLTLLIVNSAKAQDLRADLLKNNGAISARINQYDPERYNYLIGCKSVELIGDYKAIEFEGSRWQISSEVRPLEKAGKYKVTVFFSCISGEVRNASVSVDFNFKEWE